MNKCTTCLINEDNELFISVVRHKFCRYMSRVATYKFLMFSLDKLPQTILDKKGSLTLQVMSIGIWSSAIWFMYNSCPLCTCFVLFLTENRK